MFGSEPGLCQTSRMVFNPDDFEENAPLRADKMPSEAGQKIGPEALTGLIKTSHFRTIITLIVMLPFLMFSGCVALGTLIIGKVENDFYRSAKIADATVTGEHIETYQDLAPDNLGRTGQQPYRSSRYTLKQRKVFDLKFRSEAGEEIQTTISGNSGGQVVGRNSTLRIFYDPDNPKDARLYSQRDNLNLMRSIQLASIAIFLSLVVAFYLFVRRKPVAFTVILLVCGFSAPVIACPMNVPPVSAEDLTHPPEGMLAFTGEIETIETNGDLGPSPHQDFNVAFKNLQVMQGDQTIKKVTVKYGPCHSLPGQLGDRINVLARPDKVKGFYAPQFWQNAKD